MGGFGQKWPWPFSSWDPKIFCILRMNLYIDIMMQYFLVRLISFPLTFKWWGSTEVVHSVNALFSAGEIEPSSKFSKRGGLTGSHFLDGGCWERGGGWLFSGGGGCSFYIKRELKSKIFNNKKVHKQKCFCLS